MPINQQRSRGRPSNYKQDRGGVPAEYGPFIGVIMNNNDPTRRGRVQVYIETFGAGSITDDSKWIWINYSPSFYGSTPFESQGDDPAVGNYPGNPNTYGSWFCPPDLGVKVLCVFANGDRNLGFYIGVVPEEGLGHMVPAIGSAPEGQYQVGNANQKAYFAGATRLPVTEINPNNLKTFNDPKFYDKTKPVQRFVAQAMFQQGVIKDVERGPITSSSQRESPSAVFGVSTPGTAIYQGGMKPSDIRQKINSGAIKPNQARVIGRVGGHSLVMDDGNLQGENSLLRLRTSKGHQITMNDSGNFFYIIHANGQTWIELGSEGTVDIFSTNSINLRTQGDLNLHADQDVNIFAGRDFKVKSGAKTHIESVTTTTIYSQGDLTVYSKAAIGVLADGTLTVDSNGGSWNGAGSLVFTAGGIDLNGPAAGKVKAPNPLTKTTMDDTSFTSSTGWKMDPDALESIVTRAPAHEPWPYHNMGVDAKVTVEKGQPAPPPAADPVPANVSISAV